MKASELVKNWLSGEGYKYTLDEDGDLFFKYQGYTMWVMSDEKDPLFLRIVMPNIYRPEEDEEFRVLKALNTVNDCMKAVKGYIGGNGQVWISLEMYVDSSPELVDFLERCLDIILAAGHKFVDILKD